MVVVRGGGKGMCGVCVCVGGGVLPVMVVAVGDGGGGWGACVVGGSVGGGTHPNPLALQPGPQMYAITSGVFAHGRTGAAPLPGSPYVYVASSNSLQPCTQQLCPFSVPYTPAMAAAAGGAESLTNISVGSSTAGHPGEGLPTMWVNTAPVHADMSW